MIAALPQRRLWVPDWMRAPAWFTGGRVLKPGGRSLASGGQQFTPNATATCCLYQARKCSDGTLAGIYVKKSQFPSFPSTYYFSYSGSCYYVQSTDTAPCNSTPLVSGETAIASCAACTPSVCPACTSLSLVYSISGYNHAITNCAGWSSDACCPGSYPDWDNKVYWHGDSTVTCSGSSTPDQWGADKQQSPLGYFQVYSSDGFCLRLTGAVLSCEALSTYTFQDWALHLTWETVCGTGNSASCDTVYKKTTGLTPAGTYARTYCSYSSGGSVCAACPDPSSVTVS